MLPWMSARSSCVVMACPSRSDHAGSLGRPVEVAGPVLGEKAAEGLVQRRRGGALVLDRETPEFLLQVKRLRARGEAGVRRLRKGLPPALAGEPVGEGNGPGEREEPDGRRRPPGPVPEAEEQRQRGERDDCGR